MSTHPDPVRRPTAASGRPRLLLVAAHRWLQTVHLAHAAHAAGFEVALLAPPGHPAGTLTWVRTLGHYSAARPRHATVRALNRHAFDLLLPVDDLALEALVAAHADPGLAPDAVRTIERSLGDPGTFGRRRERAALAAVAAARALPAPPTVAVRGPEDLPAALAHVGLPAMLKADGSSGGRGVVMVDDERTALEAYRRLRQPERLGRAVGGLLRDDDPNLIRPAFTRQPRAITAQGFVAGTPATTTVACWHGEVLGAVTLRVVRTSGGDTGPATVVEPLEHPGIAAAAAAAVEAFGLSGVCGLDFLLLPDGTASLLELNPRATPTAHLLVARPRPLLSLLAERLGVAPSERPVDEPQAPIALFPQEAVRDPRSVYRGTAHEDIPADAPDVAAVLVDWFARPLPALPARAVRRLRGARPALRPQDSNLDPKAPKA